MAPIIGPFPGGALTAVMSPEFYLSLVYDAGTIMVLRPNDLLKVWFRKLLSSHSNRRGRHGLSVLNMLVLGHLVGFNRDPWQRYSHPGQSRPSDQ